MTHLLNKLDLSKDSLYKNLQGNILKGHGRDFTANIFIKFDKDQNHESKKWLAAFADTKVTSCKKQLKENEAYKRNKVSGDVFYGFLFTAKGYEYFNKDTSEFEHSFKIGMSDKNIQDKLNDPKVSQWEEGFRDEIHAMVLIADDDEIKLGNATRDVVEELDKLGKILTVEFGNAIRNKNGDGLEHFGYVDGISQPLFFEDELKSYIEQNNGKHDFDPSADSSQVLVNDPLTNEKDAFGSYFVFRKLEQHVRGFKTAERKLGKKLGLDGEDAERAGAMIIGRFEDGTPIAIHDEAGMIGSGAFNNFNYGKNEESNPDLSKCPFHAHIRKTNNRTDEAKKHIMARRGIPYGRRNVPMGIEQDFSQMPESGVGLLFMSFQSSLSNQFETIQANANKKEGIKNLDPIIGQEHNNSNAIIIGDFPTKYGDAGSFEEGSFDQFVHLKGGEYFFAPSIPFLKNINHNKKSTK